MASGTRHPAIISQALIQKFRKCAPLHRFNKQYWWRNSSSGVTDPSVDHSSFKDFPNHWRYKRDVPFLFLPHTVKKAYMVHEGATTLPKVFDKYKWLTKTVSSPGLPLYYEKNAGLENGDIVQLFHDTLHHTVGYQKSYKNNNNLRFIPERIKYSLMSNFLNLSLVEKSAAEHLRPENSYFYHEPLLETHWPRNYKFFQTRFRPTYVVRTRNGLEMIEEPIELTPDEVENIPGPYDDYAMNMYRHHIVHLRNRPGMDCSKFNPLKHCHTTIMVNNQVRTQEQLYSLGMFTMFAQLISQAQDSGVLHGTDLKDPLVSQCVVCNGHQMVFMVYQLNTLYLMDDKGIWNRCWYSPVLEMFEPNDNRFVVYEAAERSETLIGFNEDICRYFLTFVGKATT